MTNAAEKHTICFFLDPGVHAFRANNLLKLKQVYLNYMFFTGRLQVRSWFQILSTKYLRIKTFLKFVLCLCLQLFNLEMSLHKKNK